MCPSLFYSVDKTHTEEARVHEIEEPGRLDSRCAKAFKQKKKQLKPLGGQNACKGLVLNSSAQWGAGPQAPSQEFLLGKQKISINKLENNTISSIWGFDSHHLPWGATWAPGSVRISHLQKSNHPCKTSPFQLSSKSQPKMCLIMCSKPVPDPTYEKLVKRRPLSLRNSVPCVLGAIPARRGEDS